jgi:hypothetical protein
MWTFCYPWKKRSLADYSSDSSPIPPIDLLADWLSDEPPLATDLHRKQIDSLTKYVGNQVNKWVIFIASS